VRHVSPNRRTRPAHTMAEPPVEAAPAEAATAATAATPPAADDASGAGDVKLVRFVCISDTHNMHQHLGELPEGDVLLHCGDWSNQGTEEEELEFRTWIQAQPHRHKIFINGNHERVIKGSGKEGIRERFAGCTYLEDDGCEVEGIRLFGTPWCDVGAYYAVGEGAAKKWALIPEGTHVLVTHLPPFGIRDLACEPFVDSSERPDGLPPKEWNVPEEVISGKPRMDLMSALRKRVPKEEDPTRKKCPTCGQIHPDRQHWGGRELLDRIKVIQPVLHAFGHVHECSGVEEKDGITYLNAASHDHLRKGPYVFDLAVSAGADKKVSVRLAAKPRRAARSAAPKPNK